MDSSLVFHLSNGVLMIAIPLSLAFILMRRWKLGWRILLVGAINAHADSDGGDTRENLLLLKELIEAGKRKPVKTVFLLPCPTNQPSRRLQ